LRAKKAEGKAARKITTATLAHPQKESLTHAHTHSQSRPSSAAGVAAGVDCQ